MRRIADNGTNSHVERQPTKMNKKHLWALAMLAMVIGCAQQGEQPPSPSPLPARPRETKRVEPPPARRAMEVPDSLKRAARDVLTAAIADRDGLLRMHAVEGIKDALGSGGRDQILAAFSDPQAPVRFVAAMAAGELRLEAALPLLRRAINQEKDPHIQVAVIFALHRMGETSFSRGLEQALKSPDPEVRANAAIALGRLDEKSAVKILRPILRDPHAETRIQAAEAIWRLGDEEGLKYLVAASLSGHPAHKIVAIMGLAGPRDRKVIEHVRAGLDSEYTEVALVAARALGMLGSDEAYMVAAAAVSSPDWQQRHLAALALAAIGRADSQDLLAPLLKDAEPDVRVAAATAILQLR